MTVIQEQAIKLIEQLPDEKIMAIITLASDELTLARLKNNDRVSAKKEALNRLRQSDYVFPSDFDPETERAEAMREKYDGSGV